MTNAGHSRLRFIKKTAVVAAGINFLPGHVVSGFGYKAPGDKLNIAGVGIGGKGHSNLVGMNIGKVGIYRQCLCNLS
jgi:hypothetical protein